MTEKFQCQTEIFQSEKMVKYGKTEIFQCDTEKFQSEIFAFGERVNNNRRQLKSILVSAP